jgi:hypothetical protein
MDRNSFSIDRSFRIAAGLRCLPPRPSRIARQPSLLSATTATVTLGSPTSSLILSKIIQLKSTLDRRFLRIKIPHISAMSESYRDAPARANHVKVEGWATARRGCEDLMTVWRIDANKQVSEVLSFRRIRLVYGNLKPSACFDGKFQCPRLSGRNQIWFRQTIRSPKGAWQFRKSALARSLWLVNSRLAKFLWPLCESTPAVGALFG